jgi:hypothetical protein
MLRFRPSLCPFGGETELGLQLEVAGRKGLRVQSSVGILARRRRPFFRPTLEWSSSTFWTACGATASMHAERSVS